MSLVEDIESYGLEEGVSISSGVKSFKISGSLAITSTDTSSIGMSGSLKLSSVDAENDDSRIMSLHIGYVVPIVGGIIRI